MVDPDRFVTWLENRLKKPLPGLGAQLKLSSMARIRQMTGNKVPEDAIAGGVLILLYPFKSSTGLVLMQRPEYPGVHSGQISLPGGKYEPADLTVVQTAIRETEEEIGVPASLSRILGTLTPLFIPPSNFIVTPVVASSGSRPEFMADPGEVAEIIEIEIDSLFNSENRKRKRVIVGKAKPFWVPSYYINKKVIWGATAMILSEFVELAMEFVNQDKEKSG